MTESPPIIDFAYDRPPMYAKQQAFIDCPSRLTAIEASTKTGKTVACLTWLFERALEGQDGQNFWWVAPTYGVAGIAYRRLKGWLRVTNLPSGMWSCNESDQTIRIAGRTIWFKGADKPDALYGEDVFAAVIDEASRCKEEAWHAVRTTLTATRAPVKIIGNVRGRKNWAYMLSRKAEAGMQDSSYFRLTVYDAVEGGVVSADEVESARRELPEAVFKELYLAEPSDDGGNPFGMAAIAAAVAPLSTDAPIAYGIDLAKHRDWTVVTGLDKLGRVCRQLRWQSDWGQTRRRILDEIGKVPALADSTGVGDPIVEDLIRRGGNVEGFHFTSSSKQMIMEGLAAAVQRKETTVIEGYHRMEMESFEFEYTRGGVHYSAPEGLNDDAVCSHALAVHCKAVRPMLKVVGGNTFAPPPRSR